MTGHPIFLVHVDVLTMQREGRALPTIVNIETSEIRNLDIFRERGLWTTYEPESNGSTDDELGLRTEHRLQSTDSCKRFLYCLNIYYGVAELWYYIQLQQDFYERSDGRF